VLSVDLKHEQAMIVVEFFCECRVYDFSFVVLSFLQLSRSLVASFGRNG